MDGIKKKRTMTRIKNNNFQKKKKITNQKLLLILSNSSCFRISFKSDHFQKIHESSSIRSLYNIFQLHPKFPYLIKFRNLEIEIFKFFLQLITVRDISPWFMRKSSIIPRKGWNPVLINPVANPPRGHPPENYNFRSHSYQKPRPWTFQGALFVAEILYTRRIGGNPWCSINRGVVRVQSWWIARDSNLTAEHAF